MNGLLTGDRVDSSDLRFVTDLARRMQWDARFGDDPEADAATRVVRGQIAAGTLDALLWLLGVTELAPGSGRLRADRSVTTMARELAVAEAWRAETLPDGQDWLYLGGVADGLEFAMGRRARFWWVPLPGPMRVGPPARDEFARSG